MPLQHKLPIVTAHPAKPGMPHVFAHHACTWRGAGSDSANTDVDLLT
jgi:hypothetical protein